ncbi:mechanosensitive ion channel family protein [Desulfovibrio inopinatus]|uniref:mechanosensitive ion channel family protein n=1 Tax=Desulfovibrio inopinatus TaxID=102109 RepID=UPI000408E886|nr:mechanosensitive ion channel family protein [Desulfovibrio inopinatus]
MEQQILLKIRSMLEPLHQDIDTYIKIIETIWNAGLFGISFGKIIGALFLFSLFIFFRSRISRFIIRRAHRISRITITTIDDHLITALEAPLSFLPVVIGFFVATQYLSLSGMLDLLIQKICHSLLIIVLFWSVFNLLQPIATNIAKDVEHRLSATMARWLFKTIRAIVLTIWLATLLEIWGISIGPVLAGLGLFSVAVGLGAKDLFQNLIAGIIIISEKRFNPGDWIRVDGIVEGTVENIGFRSTRVRRFDKAPVYVPNTDLSDKAAINFSKMNYRRIYWTIGLVYATKVDQLRTVCNQIKSYITEQPDIFALPPDAPLFVHIDNFGESSINVMLYCFTKTTQWGEWLRIKEELAYAIMDIVHSSGSDFAFPSRTLYVESFPGGEQAEPFIPPTSSLHETTQGENT